MSRVYEEQSLLLAAVHFLGSHYLSLSTASVARGQMAVLSEARWWLVENWLDWRRRNNLRESSESVAGDWFTQAAQTMNSATGREAPFLVRLTTSFRNKIVKSRVTDCRVAEGDEGDDSFDQVECRENSGEHQDPQRETSCHLNAVEFFSIHWLKPSTSSCFRIAYLTWVITPFHPPLYFRFKNTNTEASHCTGKK